MEDYNFSCQFTADLIAMNTAGELILESQSTPTLYLKLKAETCQRG